MKIEKPYIYRATVRSIYDGDTIRADIDLGFDIWQMNVSLRLFGIDAPEVRGVERADGLKTKDWLVKRIPPGTEIVIETIKDQREKYGRYLAIIYFDNININEQMVNEGYADPYTP